MHRGVKRERDKERIIVWQVVSFRRKCTRGSADRLQCREVDLVRRGMAVAGHSVDLGDHRFMRSRVHRYDENFECFAALPVENSAPERFARFNYF